MLFLIRFMDRAYLDRVIKLLQKSTDYEVIKNILMAVYNKGFYESSNNDLFDDFDLPYGHQTKEIKVEVLNNQ